MSLLSFLYTSVIANSANSSAGSSLQELFSAFFRTYISNIKKIFTTIKNKKK